MGSKFKYWVGFFTIILIGCSGNPIIPQKDMVLILEQIYITDGVVSISESSLGFKDSIAYYEPILNKYGYTTSEFDSSIKYYAQRTEELDEIFDTVLSNPPMAAGREVCFRIIKESYAHLSNGGTLQIVARHNKGGKTLSEKMKEVFGNVETTANAGGFRVYLSRKTN